MAILTASSSSFSPQDAIGRAKSQSPLCCEVAARKALLLLLLLSLINIIIIAAATATVASATATTTTFVFRYHYHQYYSLLEAEVFRTSNELNGCVDDSVIMRFFSMRLLRNLATKGTFIRGLCAYNIHTNNLTAKH